MNLWELDTLGIRLEIAEGRATPAEAVDSCLERIDEVEHATGAWEFIDRETAHSAIDLALQGPLYGVPVGIKDIFNTVDMPSSMGSRLWAGFTPGNDARTVAYIRWAGCIVIGKTVTAEFAIHTPGRTLNPIDPGRTPGTSSSGSAAAVATGMVPWALGSQTAGSIIRPASYCGVYGFKPSFGVVPRIGMLKTTDTLDQVGFFCRSVRDLLVILDAIRVSGRDYPLVERTLDKDRSLADAIPAPRIGLVTDSLHVWRIAEDDAKKGLVDYAEQIAAFCSVEEFDVPKSLNEVHALHDTIYDRSIAYYFDHESQEKEMISSEVAAMIERGRKIKNEDFYAALDRQTEIKNELERSMKGFDALLTLSVAGSPPLRGELEPPDSALIWSFCGVPVIGAPVITGPGSLPIGVQFVGRRFSDHRLIGTLSSLARAGILPKVYPVTPPVRQALVGGTSETHPNSE